MAVELTDVAIEETVTIEKLGPQETLRQFEKAQEGRPVIMTLTLGNASYVADSLRRVVKEASQYPEFKFVVFINQQAEVVCYAPVRKFRAELERDQIRSDRLIAAVNEGNVGEVQSFTGMLIETVSRSTSNGVALETMQKLRLDAILAKDENSKKPIGVAERQRIINQMVMTLVKGANG